jgi:hypothetical protein
MSGKTARFGSAAALAVLLVVSAVPARAEAPKAAPAHSANVLQQIWSWFVGFVTAGETESLDHRCTVDPNGCPSGLTQAELDHRCTVDPNGSGCAE